MRRATSLARDCKRQLQGLANLPQQEQLDSSTPNDGNQNQLSKALLEEFVDIIEQAAVGEKDLQQKIKFYEKELQSLKSENQQLRLEREKQFRKSIEKLNEDAAHLDIQKQIEAEKEALRQQLQAL